MEVVDIDFAHQRKIADAQAMIHSLAFQIQKNDNKIHKIVEKINDFEIEMDVETTEMRKAILQTQIDRLVVIQVDLYDKDLRLRNKMQDEKDTIDRLRHPMPPPEKCDSTLGKRNWDLNKLGDIERRNHALDPEDTVEFFGREGACQAISDVSKSNFTNRTFSAHADFTFLVASGTIRSGKTRTGNETPRLVNEMCSTMSRTSPEINFAKSVYLKIDFLKDAKFNSLFDEEATESSVALGSRLMNAFYKHDVLKEITHDVALHHIITTVLAGSEMDSNTVVPIIIHLDEHGPFMHAMKKTWNNKAGEKYFEEMLCMIGSAATSDLLVSDFHAKGRYFIVAIATGTPFNDTNFSKIGGFSVRKVPLPVLDVPTTERLAIGLLTLRHPKWSNKKLTKRLRRLVFRVALADTAGLPGLVKFLCEARHNTSYGTYMIQRVTLHVPPSVWSHRWKSLTTIALARPSMEDGSVIEGTYTLRDALDSGTVSYDELQHEIRLAPVLLFIYNTMYGVFDSLILNPISRVQQWTWQDFEKVNVLYLAAIMMSLLKEESRFSKITLGTFLRHVQPDNNSHLGLRLLLVKFHGKQYQRDEKQCLDKPATKGRKHSVNTACETYIRLTAPRTPYVDAYMNLKLLRMDSSGVESEWPTTLFLQYKHSANTGASEIRLSEMNRITDMLAKTLVIMGWDPSRNWLILWVSNRPIKVDVRTAHPKLLWVGQSEFGKHAPLLARRGL